MNIKDISCLEFAYFNTTNPENYEDHCYNAYNLWKTQWTNTFKELNTRTVLYSDDFKNREVCGLFDASVPVGFYVLQFENFNVNFTQDLKYFSNHEGDLLNYHQNKNDKVLITTYLTSNPNWRKKFTNYSMTEVLTSLVMLRLIFSENDRIIGCYRNSHKVNELFYRHGGQFLKNDNAYNADVDFAEVTKDKAHLSPQKDHAILAVKLWKQFLNKQRGEKNEYTRSIEPRFYANARNRLPLTGLEQ